MRCVCGRGVLQRVKTDIFIYISAFSWACSREVVSTQSISRECATHTTSVRILPVYHLNWSFNLSKFRFYYLVQNSKLWLQILYYCYFYCYNNYYLYCGITRNRFYTQVQLIIRRRNEKFIFNTCKWKIKLIRPCSRRTGLITRVPWHQILVLIHHFTRWI